MLLELSIKNFAIIDDLRIRFSEGLSILSGETGAGKSIIINAVNLLLGSRASANLIRTGAEAAELEALFEVTPTSSAAAAMQAHDFDIADGLLIRRIISRQERHRVYVNGRLATMQVLKDITRHMASISGQHAHQGLMKEERQLLILDQFGSLTGLRQAVFGAYHRMVSKMRELKRLKKQRSNQADQIELLRFQKKEITAAQVFPGEDSELAQEVSRLKNAQRLYQTVYGCMEILYDANGAVVEQLAHVKKELEAVALIDPLLAAPAENVSEAVFRIEDIVQELRDYLPRIQMDETRLVEIEDRLDLLGTLKRKYGGSLEAVLERAHSIQREINATENLGDTIAALEAEVAAAYAATVQLCEKLSRNRAQAAEAVSEKVEKELATLRMPNTRFQVKLLKTPAEKGLDEHLQSEGFVLAETGMEKAAFMIAPNVGETLKPLADIASGGELSRVVLALKAILANRDAVETVVFDEVDAGIGGGVAEVVGKKLSRLSTVHQVICITHLPQIAKFGHAHYRISKQVHAGRTKTVIDRLDRLEREAEIARMLGGEEITPKTLDHAREMLEKAVDGHR